MFVGFGFSRERKKIHVDDYIPQASPDERERGRGQGRETEGERREREMEGKVEIERTQKMEGDGESRDTLRIANTCIILHLCSRSTTICTNRAQTNAKPIPECFILKKVFTFK